MAKLGRSVLMIDIDPQSSLSVSCSIDAPGESLAEVFDNKLMLKDIVKEVSDNLFLIPSDIELSEAELRLSGEMGREQVLTHALGSAKSFDFVLIDTPPSLGLLTINALRASGEVIIPARPEYLNLRAMAVLVRALKRIETKLNHKADIVGVLPTFYDSRLSHHDEVIASWRKAGLPVLEPYVRRTVRASEAPIEGMSITDYEPNNPVSEAYIELAKVVDQWQSEKN